MPYRPGQSEAATICNATNERGFDKLCSRVLEPDKSAFLQTLLATALSSVLGPQGAAITTPER